jgi:quercetin dioxygenase-like cupin family protein
VELLPIYPTAKAPADNFTGDVYVDAIRTPEAPIHLVAAAVHFTPGARTVWHTHPMGQTLHCTAGRGLIGTRDGVIVLTPGRTVQIAPDEEHWHGAGPESFMTHIAIAQTPESGPATVWGEPVTDEEYEAPTRAHED